MNIIEKNQLKSLRCLFTHLYKQLKKKEVENRPLEHNEDKVHTGFSEKVYVFGIPSGEEIENGKKSNF